MNDDQNLNPSQPVPPASGSVVVPPQPTESAPTISFDAASTANPEPVKLNEFGMPDAAPVSTPNVAVAPELPQENIPTTPIPLGGNEAPLAFGGNDGGLPPVPPAPLPQVDTPKPEKKKFGMKGIVAIVAGIALLGSLIGGGYYAYTMRQAQIAAIAGVSCKNLTSAKECNGCSGVGDTGYECKWRAESGTCQVSNIKCTPSKTPIPSGTHPSPVPNEVSPKSTCTNGNTNPNDCCNSGYFYCGGGINKCVSQAALDAQGGGCNTYGEKVYNIPTVYGADVVSSGDSTLTCAAGNTKCDCGSGHFYCFDRSGGVCNKAAAEAANAINPRSYVDPSQYNKMGLCAVAGSYDDNGTFTPKPEYKNQYDCTDTGCKASGACVVVRYNCPSGHSGSCTLNGDDPAGSYGFKNVCGTVEQIDVMCGNTMITSRSKVNPPCASSPKPSVKPSPTPSPSVKPSPSPTPSPTPTPVLACKSLTKNKSDSQIDIGTKVTLTCSGTVTPAGATTLSYKFRYNVNDGAWTNLTNATSTTAEFTPDRCGTYKAQCQVCGTINGTLVCDPTWTAASAE